MRLCAAWHFFWAAVLEELHTHSLEGTLMLADCFPQLCQVGWMSFGWWTIRDTHRKRLRMKNPAPLQF
jgi:hypothetical protein